MAQPVALRATATSRTQILNDNTKRNHYNVPQNLFKHFAQHRDIALGLPTRKYEKTETNPGCRNSLSQRFNWPKFFFCFFFGATKKGVPRARVRTRVHAHKPTHTQPQVHDSSSQVHSLEHKRKIRLNRFTCVHMKGVAWCACLPLNALLP